jgi:hypothetical protein
MAWPSYLNLSLASSSQFLWVDIAGIPHHRNSINAPFLAFQQNNLGGIGANILANINAIKSCYIEPVRQKNPFEKSFSNSNLITITRAEHGLWKVSQVLTIIDNNSYLYSYNVDQNETVTLSLNQYLTGIIRVS